MAGDCDRKVAQLTEGQVSKGGQNPPNSGGSRPPAPQGSGGAGDSARVSNQQQNSVVTNRKEISDGR